MGKTYRGLRREFGTRKSKSHFARSSWSGRNGTRLRTLAIDIAEFKAHEDSNGVSLHGLNLPAPKPIALPAPVKKKATPSAKKPTKSQKAVVVQVQQDLKTKAQIRKEYQAFLISLPIKSLEAKKAYATRQVSYLQQLCTTIALDRSLGMAQALRKLEERRRYWDTQAGTIGPILVALSV